MKTVAHSHARKSVLADGWRPKVKAALRPVLDRMIHQAALEVESGGHQFGKFAGHWERWLFEAQKSLARRMAVEAFKVGQTEGGKRGAHKSLRTEFLKGKIAGGENLDFTGSDLLIAERLEPDISDYLTRTSKLETQTIIRQIDEIWQERVAENATSGEIRGALIDLLDNTPDRADLMARTMTIWAYNEGAVAGYHDAGVERMQWLAGEDELTCETCAELDGQFGDVDGFFPGGYDHPPAHPNCLLGGQAVVSPGYFVAALFAWYDGLAVELCLADGRRLAVTANHLLPTRDGFAAAQSLRKGDYVLDGSGVQRIIAANPNDYQREAAIDDVIRARSKTRGMMACAVPAAAEYLHGDGGRVDGDIHVIRTDGLLRGTGESARLQECQQTKFASADADAPEFARQSVLDSVFRRVALASDRIMGCRRESLAFARRGAGHSQKHGPRAVALDNAHLTQAVDNRAARSAEQLGKLLDGLTGLIRPLEVVKVNLFSFHGLVYDLQSTSSLYIANGILSSNCRCDVVPVIIEEGEPGYETEEET